MQLVVGGGYAPGMVAPVASLTFPAMSELELAWPKAEGVTTLNAATAAAAIRIAREVRCKISNAGYPLLFCVGVSLRATPLASCRKSLFRVVKMFMAEPPKLPKSKDWR